MSEQANSELVRVEGEVHRLKEPLGCSHRVCHASWSPLIAIPASLLAQSKQKDPMVVACFKAVGAFSTGGPY